MLAECPAPDADVMVRPLRPHGSKMTVPLQRRLRLERTTCAAVLGVLGVPLGMQLQLLCHCRYLCS